MNHTQSDTYAKLSQELSAHNIQFRLVPISRLKDLKDNMDNTLEHEVDTRAFSVYVKRIFKYNYQESFPEAKSILVASVFNPAAKVIFQKQDRDIEVFIPQGFIKFYPKQRVLQQIVSDTLASMGYRTERILLPIKMLAVRSGLAEYGRNNITYVKGFGSSHFLGAFVTDLPAQDDFWRESKVMDECTDCNLCRLNCPTGAISDDRFLIHGEKCLTLFNENPGEFPDWINKAWHHALIGCVKCQSLCPLNADYYKDIPLLETFTTDETLTLFNASEFEALPEALQQKFAQFGFPEYHHVLLRNIKAVCSID